MDTQLKCHPLKLESNTVRFNKVLLRPLGADRGLHSPSTCYCTAADPLSLYVFLILTPLLPVCLHSHLSFSFISNDLSYSQACERLHPQYISIKCIELNKDKDLNTFLIFVMRKKKHVTWRRPKGAFHWNTETCFGGRGVISLQRPRRFTGMQIGHTIVTPNFPSWSMLGIVTALS